MVNVHHSWNCAHHFFSDHQRQRQHLVLFWVFYPVGLVIHFTQTAAGEVRKEAKILAIPAKIERFTNMGLNLKSPKIDYF